MELVYECFYGRVLVTNMYIGDSGEEFVVVPLGWWSIKNPRSLLYRFCMGECHVPFGF